MQIIIIGGGRSIKEGLSLGLRDKIKDSFIIGTNYSYKNLPLTFLCFVDIDFYREESNQIKELPLLIGNSIPFNKKDTILPNTLLFPANNSEYTRNLSKGIYKGLCGIFSLSLAIYILDSLNDNEKEIFLLGMDWGNIIKDEDKIANGFSVTEKEVDKINKQYILRDEKEYRILTHYYDNDLVHRGSGKVDYYDGHSPKFMFKWYEDIKDIKIWNVSPLSHIPTFEKIDYLEFFKKSKNIKHDQNLLRNRTKNALKKLNNQIN